MISEFPLRDREIVALYRMLKGREEQLDEAMLKLLDRLERALYRELTIDEFESIRDQAKKN